MTQTDIRPAAGATGPAYDEFQQLVAGRLVLGRTAECYRSHPGRDAAAARYDRWTARLTDELEARFPDRWEAVWADVAAEEAAYLHDPPRTRIAACPVCRAEWEAAGGAEVVGFPFWLPPTYVRLSALAVAS